MTTLHKQGKAQIYDRIQSLARFPEENPNPVIRIHDDGRLLYANRAAEPLLDEWQCDIGEQVPEEVSDEISKARASAARHPVVQTIGERTFYLDFTPVADSRYCNIYGRDITEQHRYQERLRIVAKFPDENPSPVLRIDIEGTVLYANERSTPLLRTWRTAVGAKVPADVLERIREAAEDGESTNFEVECQCDDRPNCTDATSYWVQIAPIPGTNYANVYGKDITESNHFRALLSNHQQAIREPLTKVLGACELLQDCQSRDDLDKLMAEVQRLGDAARWLMSVLDEISD